jgi:hypothetical protein
MTEAIFDDAVIFLPFFSQASLCFLCFPTVAEVASFLLAWKFSYCFYITLIFLFSLSFIFQLFSHPCCLVATPRNHVYAPQR